MKKRCFGAGDLSPEVDDVHGVKTRCGFGIIRLVNIDAKTVVREAVKWKNEQKNCMPAKLYCKKDGL